MSHFRHTKAAIIVHYK